MRSLARPSKETQKIPMLNVAYKFHFILKFFFSSSMLYLNSLHCHDILVIKDCL
ncbi:hypothetical protein HanRHA438_Chr07g0304831 [Helianthus annuus]|nr:hypothetical protein HanRHA438_Chr07g0304831 [Helianthus annuus]